MYFRQTARKVVKGVKNGMSEGELDEFRVGEHLLHLAADGRVDSKVVIDPQEAAGGQIAAQVRHFARRKFDVSVTAHEDERVLEQRGGAGFDDRFAIPRDLDRGAR